MIDFDIPKHNSSIIKVIGVGGGGGNAVNYMFSKGAEGVDFVICNTDAKALEMSPICNKVQLGPSLTQGLGAGANPEIGKQATEESLDEIRNILEVNTKMAFICAGMGGGTGTGGAPVVAKICKDLGILTVGIVTTPFDFEGPIRKKQAEAGIKELQPYVDTLLIISNEKLKALYTKLKMSEAFSKADAILEVAARCITDIIKSKGHIVVDFADVCTVMRNGGVAMLSNAKAEGEDRAKKAIEAALKSPLLNDNDIKGARWILLNVSSHSGEFECEMEEFELINSYVRENAGEHTDFIVGISTDETLTTELAVTLIATGFENKDPFAQEQKNVEVQKESAEINLSNKKAVDSLTTTVLAPVAEEEIQSANESSLKKVVEPNSPQDDIANMPETKEFILSFEEKTETIPSIDANLSIGDKEDNIIIEKPAEDVASNIENTNTFVLDLSEFDAEQKKEVVENTTPLPPLEKMQAEDPIAQRNFLAKPSVIYADEKNVEQSAAESGSMPAIESKNDVEQNSMFFIETKETTHFTTATSVMGFDSYSEEELKRKRVEERIGRLTNIDNPTDDAQGLDYENVPAYVRRNMQKINAQQSYSPDEYYSNISIKKEKDCLGNISTRNKFLEGEIRD